MDENPYKAPKAEDSPPPKAYRLFWLTPVEWGVLALLFLLLFAVLLLPSLILDGPRR
jgi:hypothetical protein